MLNHVFPPHFPVHAVLLMSNTQEEETRRWHFYSGSDSFHLTTNDETPHYSQTRARGSAAPDIIGINVVFSYTKFKSGTVAVLFAER